MIQPCRVEGVTGMYKYMYIFNTHMHTHLPHQAGYMDGLHADLSNIQIQGTVGLTQSDTNYVKSK